MEKYDGLRKKMRIVIFGHAVVPVSQIQSLIVHKFPFYEVGVCRDTTELEDVFYGLLRQRVVNVASTLSVSSSKYKRKRRTLPKAVIHNGCLKEDEGGNPWLRHTVECDGAIVLGGMYDLPVMRYSAESKWLQDKDLERIRGELEKVLGQRNL